MRLEPRGWKRGLMLGHKVEIKASWPGFWLRGWSLGLGYEIWGWNWALKLGFGASLLHAEIRALGQGSGPRRFESWGWRRWRNVPTCDSIGHRHPSEPLPKKSCKTRRWPQVGRDYHRDPEWNVLVCCMTSSFEHLDGFHKCMSSISICFRHSGCIASSWHQTLCHC